MGPGSAIGSQTPRGRSFSLSSVCVTVIQRKEEEPEEGAEPEGVEPKEAEPEDGIDY